MSFLLGFAFSAIACAVFISIRFGSIHQKEILVLKQAEKEAEQKLHEATLSLLEEKNALQSEKYELKKREQELATKERAFARENERQKKQRSFLEKKAVAIEQSLEKTAQLSSHQARELILDKTRDELDRQLEQLKHEQNLRADHQAKTILFSALEKGSVSLTKELISKRIPITKQIIPKIIGKDGRNIQMLEELLQVSIFLDEEVSQLVISSNDPEKRYAATLTVEFLLSNEKITPTTIKTAQEKTVSALSKSLFEESAAVCQNLGLSRLPKEVVEMLSKLRMHTSAGQNTFLHSVEVAKLMACFAQALDLDVQRATLIGLVHDIGKALPQSWGASHALAGKAYLSSCGIEPSVCHAVAAHHREERAQSQEAILLTICDRLSAQAARHEKSPFFLSLVQNCEELARAVPEVNNAWAHYAGSHIELLIDTSNKGVETPVLNAVEEIRKTLPVLITLMPRSGAHTDQDTPLQEYSS